MLNKNKAKERYKYYSLTEILKRECIYMMIIGERSNGKTYAVLEYAIKHYVETGGQLAILRRWQEDFRGKRGNQMFDSLVENKVIEKATNGEWTGITYYSGRWFFSKIDEETKKVVKKIEPFAFAFSLASFEHDKSTSYPKIEIVLFDEFLSRGEYLKDEFVTFQNCLSTIIRQRDNVRIFMLGNTVNKYSPYFNEMGLYKVKNMDKGTIQVYEDYEDNKELKVAVEFADSISKTGKASDKYFAFGNTKLNMITGGVWEMNKYPHCPVRYFHNDVLFEYFIIFNNELLQCDIVLVDDLLFTYIHYKTTPIKNEDIDLIYTTEDSARPNYRKRITKPTSPIEKKIANFFITNKVFYQDDNVGELVRNYLIWCKGNNIE